MSALAAAVELFHSTAPRRPFCTDYPRDGQYMRAQSVALQHRHIQPNTPGKVAWLCFDIDRPDASERWDDANAAAPTLLMRNPANGHAHYAYALQVPVSRTELSRIRPLQYLAAIQEGTRRKLGADPGYSGGLIKTPGHPAWHTESHAGVYGLGELSEWCHLPSPTEMRRMAANADYAGLGRNCTLFEHLRKQSYQDVRKFWQPGGFDPFREHCLTVAESMNGQFSNPLPQSELKSIAYSVAKWIWQRFNPTEFRAIQSRRGSRKGAAKRDAFLPEVLRLIREGNSQREVAAIVGVPVMTINGWLNRE